MKLLALDTATELCSAALCIEGVCQTRECERARGSGELILGMIEQLLAESALSLKGLDAIAFGCGPGAFTGVRLALAVAQGLGLAAGLPLLPISDLRALALRAMGATNAPARALICQDARMGEVYWGCFAWDAACGVLRSGALHVGPPGSVSLDSGTQYIGVGRGFSAYPVLAMLPGVTTDAARSAALPNAREIARLGARRLEGGGALDAADLQPLYLRDKVASTAAERAARSPP